MPFFTAKFRYQHWVPRTFGIQAIVLYPYVLFALARAEVHPILLNHEMIHIRQVRKLGWARFYIQYVWEYARLRARGLSRGEAYMAISFEREAYAEAEFVQLSAIEKREAGLA